MNSIVQRLTAIGTIGALAVFPALPLFGQEPTGTNADPPPLPLRDALQKGYPELFDLSPTLHFEAQEIQKLRDSFKTGEDSCRRTFRNHSKAYQKQIESARKDLKAGGEKLSTGERHDLHCSIQNFDMLKSEADVLAGHAIPTAYDNLNAKLDLIQQWPEQYRVATAEIASGSYTSRRWGDVKDIGFREIAAGQRDDIKRGQQALEEMRRAGLLPPALENKAIQNYVEFRSAAHCAAF